MQIVIKPDGTAECLYDEAIELGALGSLAIARASHVEPDERGRWVADLGPVQGPRLGPFERRSEALAAERAWLEGRMETQALADGGILVVRSDRRAGTLSPPWSM